MKAEKQSRTIVWIFGAGASRGAGAFVTVQKSGRIPIPTQNDFWQTVLRFANPIDRKVIEAFLFRYFNGYKKTPTRVKPGERRKLFNQVDVEEVFTFLSERTSTSTISSQLKTYFQETIWEALIRSVASTFRKFNSNKQTRAIYHEFAENHLRKRDAIITFNYDRILETSLNHTKWHYHNIGNGGIPVFKPHGSVNWAEKEDRSIRQTNSISQPLIVAPSHLKFIGLKDLENHPASGYLNTNPTITSIWNKMEEKMKLAKALVFVGYSFPDADLYFSSVLRTVLTNSTRQIKIVIVNPDAQRISEKLRRRFSLDIGNIQNHFDFKTFCKLKRKDII